MTLHSKSKRSIQMSHKDSLKTICYPCDALQNDNTEW